MLLFNLKVFLEHFQMNSKFKVIPNYFGFASLHSKIGLKKLI